jgi:hypothetical protein
MLQHICVRRGRPGCDALVRLLARLHRAQVDGNVRRVGHQAAGGIEERAREVEPLLDVRRHAAA